MTSPLIPSALFLLLWSAKAFQVVVPVPENDALRCSRATFSVLSLTSSQEEPKAPSTTVEGASRLLNDWDRHSNPDSNDSVEDYAQDLEELRPLLPEAVRFLCQVADAERSEDSTKGRCMLGICASDVAEGVNTLKSWVTALELPRGLLHGMDKDGVPLDIDGGVYIKYNTGGVISFAEIRKSGLGFDALWKPGDALLEPYDGIYRGVYFQVELSDGEFRQYLVPLDTFSIES